MLPSACVFPLLHHKALDVTATEAMLGDWVRGAGAPGHGALDGKRLRGSAPGGHDGSEGVHLVAAFANTLGGVIQFPTDWFGGRRAP